jgi:hypothetical protein
MVGKVHNGVLTDNGKIVQYVALRLSMPQAFHCLPIVKAHLSLGCSYRSILNVSRLRSFISIGNRCSAGRE